MQGEYGTLKKVKSKLTKIGMKSRDGDDEEDDDLPEDSDREASERKIKQKLIKLREKLGDEIYEDSELAKVKLKQRIGKLSEKLKKISRDEEELFEDAEDKEKTGVWLKQRIIKLGEKLRRDGEEFSEEDEPGKWARKKQKKLGEEEETKKSGRTIKLKFPKGNTKFYQDNIETDPADGAAESSGKGKVVRFDHGMKSDPEESGSSALEKDESSGEMKRRQLPKSDSVKSCDGERTLLDFEFLDIKAVKDSISCKCLKKAKNQRVEKLGREEEECSGSAEDDETKISKSRGLLSPRKAKDVEGSDEAETVSQSGSEGKGDAIDFQGVEGNLLEKLGQRLKERSDKVQRYFQRTNKLGEVNRRLKSQIWSSVVTIVLVEGKNLQAMDIDGFSDPYVKFRLGNEKYKSKVIYKTLNPSWLEQFDLHLYDDQNQELELTIWDKDRSKDDFMGRCCIDLSQLERETTHSLWQDVEEGSGSIHLLLTISGTTASETISDLTTYEENPRERTNIENRYALRNTLHNLRDVGHLTVKVYRATGLAAADLGGKSDPFCVLELVNARLQTQTEYKTLSPSWQKIFTFNVKDINSVLEVTVFDEDRDHKVEFLGKVSIPLLRIRNGEKRWYCLKDKKLHIRAKGNCPMILLEMNVVWNPIRAWIRTLNPKEEKYMQGEVKFKRQIFVRNVLRLKAIIMVIIEWGKLIQECFEWERPAQSAVALVLFIALCYYFQPYMLLAALLIVFLKYYIVSWLTGDRRSSDDEEEPVAEDEDDDEDKDKEEKKTLKERLHAIQEVTQTVQNAIGYIASLGEQVKNTFNFSVPFISYLAMGLVFIAMIIVYFIPVRYLIMAFGVNKFARKLLRPHTIPNNEILDLLSRVPDDEELICYREFRPYASGDVDRRNQRKKQKGS
ncbi:UNVERIFIED_CONTAM: hypothetical protein PYX00_000131 [Menopon gallinae]|uniref:C2 domain-containing protein n=1 Tax=Menopon gallinae TaxID=328185 RepID=A0AAW2I7T5_9NEOP